MIAMATGSVLRTLGHTPISAPAAPTLSVTNDGDGDAVTAVVTGAAGASHQLHYATGGGALTPGNIRIGNGSITQDNLDANTSYTFVCVSTVADQLSLPSAPSSVYVSADTSPPTATGERGLFLSGVADIMAASDSFQTWVDAANADEAALSIYYGRVKQDVSRPFACIDSGPTTMRTEAGGPGAVYRNQPVARIAFESDVPTAYAAVESNAYIDLLNTIDAIIADMFDLSGAARAGQTSHIAIANLTQRTGPDRSVPPDPHEEPENQDGDYFVDMWELTGR